MFNWLKKWLDCGKEVPVDISVEQKVEQVQKEPDFMTEQTDFGDVTVDYNIVEKRFEKQHMQFLPSFKKRLDDLLNQSVEKNLEAEISGIHFVAYCFYEGQDRNRKNGDEVLNFIEKYINFDRNWIKEIAFTVDSTKRWQRDSYETEWAPTYRYRVLAQTLMTPEILELAEKYDERPEEIRKIVVEQILTMAATTFPDQSVPPMVKVYDVLFKENAPVEVYKQISGLLEEIDQKERNRFGAYTEERKDKLQKLSLVFTDNFDTIKSRDPKEWVLAVSKLVYEGEK